MMVETSPDVAAALGISPETFPIATFLGGLGVWATNLWLVVDELHKLNGAPQKRERVVSAAVTPTGPGPGLVLPIPPEPPGAPPKVT